jgi:Transforming growth factor beta like domain
VIHATQTLEVRIETVGPRDDEQPLVDINTKPHNDNEPLLLIFSNDRRRRKFESRELHEMIEHEMDGVEDPAEFDEDDADAEADYEEDESEESVDGDQYEDVADQRLPPSDDHVALISRIERDTERVLLQINDSSSRKTSGNTDYLNGTDVSTAAAREQAAGVDHAMPMEHHHHHHQQQQQARKRVKRARKRRSRKNICRRKPMYVSFEDIHWDEWIIQPKGYQVSCKSAHVT